METAKKTSEVVKVKNKLEANKIIDDLKQNDPLCLVSYENLTIENEYFFIKFEVIEIDE